MSICIWRLSGTSLVMPGSHHPRRHEGASSVTPCPQSTALRGLLEDTRTLLTAVFLTEGCVLWPVPGSIVRCWGVWSPFLLSHFLEPSHTFLRIPWQSGHLHLISCKSISCPSSKELGSNSTGTGLGTFTKMTAHTWENAPCPYTPLCLPCVLPPQDPLPVSPLPLPN